MKNSIAEEKNNQKLTALLSLYNNILNDIRFYQNSGNSLDIISVIVAVTLPVLQYLKTDILIQSIICLAIPIVQIAGLQRGLESHTFVALLRGYATYIEQKINNLIDDEIFMYNTYLIDKYIAKQKIGKKHGLKYSMLVVSGSQLFVAIMAIIFFYSINILFHTDIWILIICGIWFSVCEFFALLLCIKFIKKENIRRECPSMCKSITTSQISN